MEKQNYEVSIEVKATPQKVFAGINNVSKWWSEDMEGSSKELKDEFTVRFGETWITVRIVELVPGRKIGWQVIDCYKHWLKDKKEWKGTKMNWEISAKNDATQITFVHIGLVPGVECYEGCEKAWDQYIKDSLFRLLTEGKGVPELK